MEIRIEKSASFSLMGYYVSESLEKNPSDIRLKFPEYKERFFSVGGEALCLYGAIINGENNQSSYLLGIKETVGIEMSADMDKADIPAASYAVCALPEEESRLEAWNQFVGKELPDKGYIFDIWRGIRLELYMDEGGFELWAPVVSPEPLGHGLLAFSRIDGIDIAPALKRLGGRQSILETSAKSTGKSIPERINKAALYLESGTQEEFILTVHGLKGSLATIGAHGLSQLAARIEQAAKNGETAYCRENFPVFAADTKKLGEQLTDIFS